MPLRELISLLDRWTPKHIVVAGDFMLDRYAYGNAERLSPDAPVPVLAIIREEDKAGGAANVCLDLKALRCEVWPLGVVGDDATGEQLRQCMSDAGCETRGLLAVSGRPTTVKQNFVGLAQHRHPQKMFRVDTEDKSALGEATGRRLLDEADALLASADVLCLEDYNKGVLSHAVCQGLIERAKRRGIPVLVDPAAIDDYSKYRGATCITPNRTEAERATGRRDVGNDRDALTTMARSLKQQCELETIVLTLDKLGALLLEDDAEPVLVPTLARQVYDVTGAGDMVLAMLAAARANDADWQQAVELANAAAGLEVEKFGVVPIALDEILLSLLASDGDGSGKLRRLEHLLPELAAHRGQGKKIAFTNGCFDILHAGHVQYLRHAARHGDLLVVGVNSDASIRRLKGPQRPINQADDRVLVLSELECVDYVVLFDADTPTELIQAIRPDALVKGADYTREQVVGHDIVESYGGQVVLVPLVEGRSTTNIIEKVRG
ncbi:MAG: D-glycero-beta-D-manno-heptose 1-phosphate adenylyltransferase [Phycisphaeraceae bacterium]